MIIRTFQDIAEIPEAVWEEVRLNQSVTLSHAFWKVVERSGLNDFSYRYLVAFDPSDRAVGAMTAYVVTTDIAIFAPLWLKELLGKVRAWAPNFLKWRMLECGTPISINSPPWFCIEQTDHEERVRNELLAAASSLARQERVLVTVVRDFDDSTGASLERMKSLNYAIVAGLPNTILELPWQTMDAYLQSMKSYYRSKLLKHVRRCEQSGFSYAVIDDFSELSGLLCQQWLVVHSNAEEYQREILTPEFYRGISDAIGIDARVVLVYRDGVVVAHALMLFDGHLARWMYFGRNVVKNDGLYLFTAYAVIESAINAGMKALELGVTNYQTKLDLGVSVVPLKFAISFLNGSINRIAGRVYNLLNKLPVLESRDVFKKPPHTRSH